MFDKESFLDYHMSSSKPATYLSIHCKSMPNNSQNIINTRINDSVDINSQVAVKQVSTHGIHEFFRNRYNNNSIQNE